MTNGTSQGLFIVVAIIIFGIFILTSYLLFRDNLKPTVANIFTDGLEQAKDSVREKWNNAYQYDSNAQLSFYSLDEENSEIGYRYSFDINSNEIQNINITKKTFDKLYKINGDTLVLNRVLVINGRNPTADAIKHGFKEEGKHNSKLTIQIDNGNTTSYKRSDSNWTRGNFISGSLDTALKYNLTLKIGEVSTIKIKDYNSYGGVTTTTVKLKVNIIE